MTKEMQNRTVNNGVSRGKLEAITTVYSYRFPEIRTIISDLAKDFPHDIYSKSITGELDTFDQPIIDKVVKFYGPQVPALADFKFRYPTSGSEEGIREIMSDMQCKGVKKIRVFKGEYEGYSAVAATRNIETEEVPFDVDVSKLTPAHWFISNPTARNGTIIPNSRIKEICDAGNQVFYDMAYLGSTRQNVFDIDHENIFATVVSFSKSYGVFYDRIGFAFSKKEVPCLYANKWFKNLFSLMIAEKIVDTITPNYLYDKYRPLQEEIVRQINKDTGLPLKVADALLLANFSAVGDDAAKLNAVQRGMVEKHRRDDNYRFCLTPYYLKAEKGELL
jgi:histidinol-phosphate/aromatic aminotransferase/cobyric acid decarboxylase-like protein